MTERCEWSATNNEPARSDNEQCPNEATVCVGRNGTYHLCAMHAGLPRFRRFKQTELRRPDTSYGLGYNQPRCSR